MKSKFYMQPLQLTYKMNSNQNFSFEDIQNYSFQYKLKDFPNEMFFANNVSRQTAVSDMSNLIYSNDDNEKNKEILDREMKSNKSKIGGNGDRYIDKRYDEFERFGLGKRIVNRNNLFDKEREYELIKRKLDKRLLEGNKKKIRSVSMGEINDDYNYNKQSNINFNNRDGLKGYGMKEYEGYRYGSKLNDNNGFNNQNENIGKYNVKKTYQVESGINSNYQFNGENVNVHHPLRYSASTKDIRNPQNYNSYFEGAFYGNNINANDYNYNKIGRYGMKDYQGYSNNNNNYNSDSLNNKINSLNSQDILDNRNNNTTGEGNKELDYLINKYNNQNNSKNDNIENIDTYNAINKNQNELSFQRKDNQINNNDSPNSLHTTNFKKSSIEKDENASLQNNSNSPNQQNDYFYSPIVKSLDEIKYLPPEEQIKVLFRNNQTLSQSLKDLENKYNKLKEGYNKLQSEKKGENQNNNTQFKDMILKENRDLKLINKRYEDILEPLINFFNDMIIPTGKQPIDMIKLNQIIKGNTGTEEVDQREIEDGIKKLKEYIEECRNNANENMEKGKTYSNSFMINEKENNNHKKKKGKSILNKFKKSRTKIRLLNHNQSHNNLFGYRKEKKNKNGSITEKVDDDNSNDYDFEYYRNREINCYACNLGVNNSSRGYSPLMCSPNREKYTSKEK